MITAGIDIGSIAAKAVVMKDRGIVSHGIVATGHDPAGAAYAVFETALSGAGVSPGEIGAVIATGYGRKAVDFADRQVTEITCHAAAAVYLKPGIRFVIDIGGQDSKAILLNGQGKVINFQMNDKCAAGTGRFLEVMVRALNVPLESLGDMARRAQKPAAISNVCTVFAESEVISLISRGEERENIIAGINEAIATRVAAMAARVGLASPIMLTGGVAKNSGVVRALFRILGEEVHVSPYAQFGGAIGAALLAQGETG